MNNNVIPLLDILIFFATIFVGDHTLLGLPSFIIVWFGLMMYRSLTGVRFFEREFVIQAVFFIFVSPLILYGVITSDAYYFAFIQMVLIVNVFPVLDRVLSAKITPVILLFLMTAMLFVTLVFLEGLRGSVVFGPNIMYRIYGVSFFVAFWSIRFGGVERSVLLSFIYIVSCAGLFMTGSRGAVVVALLATGFFLSIYWGGYLARAVSFFVVFAGAFFVAFNWEYLQIVAGRLLYFDIENDSEAARLGFFYKIFEFYENENFLILVGAGNGSEYFPVIYPHNIVIEVLVYHGLIYGLVALFLALKLLNISRINIKIFSIVSIFLPVIFGSLLSGSLRDNCAVLSLLVVPFILKSRKGFGGTCLT